MTKDNLTNEELILLEIIFLNALHNSNIDWGKVILRETFKEEQLIRLARLKLIEIEAESIKATELGREYLVDMGEDC